MIDRFVVSRASGCGAFATLAYAAWWMYQSTQTTQSTLLAGISLLLTIVLAVAAATAYPGGKDLRVFIGGALALLVVLASILWVQQELLHALLVAIVLAVVVAESAVVYRHIGGLASQDM